MLHSLA